MDQTPKPTLQMDQTKPVELIEPLVLIEPVEIEAPTEPRASVEPVASTKSTKPTLAVSLGIVIFGVLGAAILLAPDDERPAPRSVATCAPPAPSADAKLVAFGTSTARDLHTDVAMGPVTEGHATWSINVTIEPGAEPLYLLLSAYESTIWNFSGDTDRIERVILVDRIYGAGSEGLPAEKVTVVTDNCYPQPSQSVSFIEAAASDPVLGPIEAAINREFEAVFASDDTDNLSLPSGRVTPSATAPMPWSGVANAIHEVDRNTLVTSRPIERP